VGRPQLLVSVRSPEEALLAVRGGADIVDVKEPSAGPLGMAPLDTLRRILQTFENIPQPPPLSFALGELRDWFGSCPQPAKTASAFREAFAGLLQEHPAVCFLKCGLAGCRSIPNWEQHWAQLRQLATPAVAWVAVAYADADRADAPDPAHVLSAAIDANARVVLIDTFVKDGKRLPDWLSPTQLQAFARECHRHNMLLALAGQVSHIDFPVLRDAGADVIAVRGAACDSADRLQSVSEHRVRALVEALRADADGP
jgi:hypothetical protein